MFLWFFFAANVHRRRCDACAIALQAACWQVLCVTGATTSYESATESEDMFINPLVLCKNRTDASGAC